MVLLDLARRHWPHPSSPDRIEDLPLAFTAESFRKQGEDDEALDEPVIDLPAAKALLDQFASIRDKARFATTQEQEV